MFLSNTTIYYTKLYSRQYVSTLMSLHQAIQRTNPRKLEGCLTVHLPHGITWNASLMQQGGIINIFLVRHVSGTYAHHQEQWNVELHHMVYCTEFLDGWSWEPLHRSCVRCGWCRASHGTIRTAHTTYAAALKNITHPKTRCRKPYAATQHSIAPDDGRMYPKHVELRIH
jgi:hypothetical protein